MCRFLMMRGEPTFEPNAVLAEFRERCRVSPEYQGHGWGAAWRTDGDGEWSRYRSLTPIWDDVLELPDRVDFLVVHARSAFRDQDIVLENNMPFYRRDLTFVFNGELHRVKLRLPGRIGAEKVFHLIEQSADAGLGLEQAIVRADETLMRTSERVRALNIGITDGKKIYASCRYDESPDYFTLHYRRGAHPAVCSEPLDDTFTPMANGEHVVV